MCLFLYNIETFNNPYFIFLVFPKKYFISMLRMLLKNVSGPRTFFNDVPKKHYTFANFKHKILIFQTILDTIIF